MTLRDAYLLMTLISASMVLPTGAIAEATDESSEEPIEEITVVGEKTLLNLKFAAYQAEEDFFELFNELNEDDEFDVFCDKESNTYSRVKRRRCWSPFEREIEEDAMRDMVGASGQLGAGTRRLPLNEGLIRAKRKQQAEMLKQMVLENPELQELYSRYGEANIEYFTERERRCADNLLCLDPDRKDQEESEE
jgi:hypothetical protein